MSRPKVRIRRRSPDPVVVPAGGRSGWWGLVKAIAGCGAVGGLIAAAIGGAVATEGYARPAALIGGVPAAAIGACVLGWSGRRFGRKKRLRNGPLVGAILGLLGAGTLGAVAGLSVWAVPWSLLGAVVGGVIHASLTVADRRSLGVFPGVMIGLLVGIWVRADRTGSVGVMAGVFYGAIAGAVLGVLLIPTLLAWLLELPRSLRRRGRQE